MDADNGIKLDYYIDNIKMVCSLYKASKVLECSSSIDHAITAFIVLFLLNVG